MYKWGMQVLLSVRGRSMKEILRPVTQKGQVTIPIEIRKALGIKPKGKVAFEIDGQEVRVKAAKSVVEATHRILPALDRKLTVEEMVQIATEEAAQEAAREGLG